MSKFLPCPFCASKRVDTDYGLNEWVVWCLDCTSAGPERTTPAEARIAWNRRTPTDTQDTSTDAIQEDV